MVSGDVAGVLRGLEVGIHRSDVALTLARCPPRWSVCPFIRVSAARFSECARL